MVVKFFIFIQLRRMIKKRIYNANVVEEIKQEIERLSKTIK